MSGVCAVWQRSPEGLAGTLAAMTAGLALVEGEQIRQKMHGGAGVGVAARFDTQQIYEDPRVLIACDAELYNEEELRESLGRQEEPRGDGGIAALLARLYERFGGGFVEKLRGAFSIILWDRRERRSEERRVGK